MLKKLPRKNRVALPSLLGKGGANMAAAISPLDLVLCLLRHNKPSLSLGNLVSPALAFHGWCAAGLVPGKRTEVCASSHITARGADLLVAKQIAHRLSRFDGQG